MGPCFSSTSTGNLHSLPAGRQVSIELWWQYLFFKNSFPQPLFKNFSRFLASILVSAISL
jgi:hypothetical protein